MTPKERVAMQQALEALEMYRPLFLPIKLLSQDKTREEAITALREALAEQSEQEPVAWKHDCAALCANDVELWIDNCPHCGKPRTAAPVRTKDLTDDEICDVWVNCEQSAWNIKFARAVIAADREKNRG